MDWKADEGLHHCSRTLGAKDKDVVPFVVQVGQLTGAFMSDREFPCENNSVANKWLKLELCAHLFLYEKVDQQIS